MRAGNAGSAERLLEIQDLTVGYGVIPVLKGVSAHVDRGEVVALLGANGAGKTTTVMTVAGVLRPWSGRVLLGGEPISGLPAAEVARLGVAVVPEGRQVFSDLTVAENLAAGAFRHSDRRLVAETLEQVLGIFPKLAERYRQRAGTLSGGEQQMLAIGRALMSRPRVLLTDELSMGLAPRVVEQVYEAMAQVAASGVTMLIVEQNTRMALGIASRGYVLANGQVVLSAAADELRSSEILQEAYLGARVANG